jgi:hypothetical protein
MKSRAAIIFAGIFFFGCAAAKNHQQIKSITYKGMQLDAVYESRVPDSTLIEFSDISLELHEAAASSWFLEKVMNRLPNDGDELRKDLIPIGILAIGYSDGTKVIYYTDGQYLCTKKMQCLMMTSKFRSFIDPTYDALNPFFKSFSEPES